MSGCHRVGYIESPNMVDALMVVAETDMGINNFRKGKEKLLEKWTGLAYKYSSAHLFSTSGFAKV